MPAAPRPGSPVRGSSTGRPIMALFDLLGRRLALRVLWELRDGEPVTFRDLQARCDQASASTLNQRLSELVEVGIVERAGGYQLTGQGRGLLEILERTQDWANTWARTLTEE